MQIHTLLPACDRNSNRSVMSPAGGTSADRNIAYSVPSSSAGMFSFADSLFHRTEGGIWRWADGTGGGGFYKCDILYSQFDVWIMCILSLCHVLSCIEKSEDERSDSVFTFFIDRIYFHACGINTNWMKEVVTMGYKRV